MLTTGYGLLYSTDETNIWKELNEENVVECNKSISIKFSGSKPEGTVGSGLHYVEKIMNIINILMTKILWNGDL